MKNHLFSVAVISLVLTVLSGCMFETRLIDYSQKDGYKQMIGQKYKLKVDCYIVDYTEKPYSIIDAGSLGLPKIPNKKYIGQKYGEKIIRGIVYKGTEFRIISAYYIDGFNVSGFDFHIKLLNNNVYSGLLSARLLRGYNPTRGVFHLNPKYVRKLEPEKEN